MNSGTLISCEFPRNEGAGSESRKGDGASKSLERRRKGMKLDTGAEMDNLGGGA